MLKLEVSEGLYLRSFNIDDTEMLMACMQVNIDHLQKWIPWVNPQSHIGQVQEFIHQQMQALEHQEGMMLGIFLGEELIGMAGLQDWDHAVSMAELGFWLSKEHLRKGLMSKVLERLVQFGFLDMQLQRITATFPIANVGAHKLLERSGFKLEGVLRHHMLHHGLKTNMVVMGYLAGEWVH